MMRITMIRTSAMLATAVFAIGLASGCGSKVRPEVQDFDSYQVIRMGPVRYITPEGMKVVKEGRDFVIHEDASIPGTTFTVRTETSPPRSLKFDADAEKRMFLSEVDQSRLTSAQYDEDKKRRTVTIFIEGLDEKTNTPLYGMMKVMRDGDDTASIRALGPRDQRHRITPVVERLSRDITLGAE